jgi:hypothetical protein
MPLFGFIQIEFFDPVGMLLSLLTVHIPFVFLWRIKKIKFSREETALIALSIAGTLVDHRAFIYASFVFAHAYLRSGEWKTQKAAIAVLIALQLLNFVYKINYGRLAFTPFF